MPEHLLRTALTLPLPPAEVFPFFADAANLGRITPPELDFAILTPLPVVMQAGTRIDYRLKLFGLPFHWTTEIALWDPPHAFIDRQLKGPYRQWQHRHTFSATADGGTLVEDEVRYRLPLFPLGEAALPLVQPELARIFAFREAALRRLLLPAAAPAPPP